MASDRSDKWSLARAAKPRNRERLHTKKDAIFGLFLKYCRDFSKLPKSGLLSNTFGFSKELNFFKLEPSWTFFMKSSNAFNFWTIWCMPSHDVHKMIYKTKSLSENLGFFCGKSSTWLQKLSSFEHPGSSIPSIIFIRCFEMLQNTKKKTNFSEKVELLCSLFELF